jgi:hypothetical protein
MIISAVISFRHASGLASALRTARLLPLAPRIVSWYQRVPLNLRPIDSFSLRLKVPRTWVRMVSDDTFIDMASLQAALGARFNVNVCHVLLSPV